MATLFAKQFSDIVGDFDSATQSALGVLKKNSDAGPSNADGTAKGDRSKLKDELAAMDKKEDDLLAGLDQITSRVTKSLKVYDLERRLLDGELKTKSKDDQRPPDHAPDFEKIFEASKKALEHFAMRVKSDMMRRTDLGDKFPRAAAAFFTDVKKFQVTLRKDGNTLLNKAEGGDGDDKPLEVEPSTFLIDYKKLVKDTIKELKEDEKVDRKNGKEAEKEEAKKKKFKENALKALASVDDRLKRVDTNPSFDKVEPLCDAAVGAIKDAVKALSADKEYASTGSSLLKLVHEIEAYDKKMFLFSRLKG